MRHVNAFQDRRTALMEASKGGHTEVVKLLVENKANLNAQDDVSNINLIQPWHMHSHYLDIIIHTISKILVENNADFNVQGKLIIFDKSKDEVNILI